MTNKISLQRSCDNDQRHRIALCLGAHRSGTSLLAAAIEAIGAELALPVRNTNEENLKGFFEHAEIVALNEDLLELADSAWDDGLFDGESLTAVSPRDREKLQERALGIVDRHLRSADLSAIKDPRMCRLLPFWLPALNAAGYVTDDIRCVIVTREPVEIAISQRTRCRKNVDFYEFGQNLAEGTVLWLNHIRQVLRDCENYQVFVISYHDFLERPAELMGSLAKFLDAQPDQDVMDLFVSEFVTESLWRSHADDKAVAEIEAAFPGVLEIERDLASLSGRAFQGKELEPILAALRDPAYDAAIKKTVSRAYGRLSRRRRAERQEALKNNHALEVVRQERNAFAKSRDEVINAFTRSRDEVVAAAKKLEQQLRQQIIALEAGIASRNNILQRINRDYDLALAKVHEMEDQLQDLERIRQERDTGQQEEARLEKLLQREQSTIDSLVRQRREAARLLDRQKKEAADRLAELTKNFEDLRHSADYLRQDNNALRASNSWRVTAPLRAAGTAFRVLKRLPQRGLRNLNYTSQNTSQRLKQFHPWTANVLRLVTQPMVKRDDINLLCPQSTPAVPALPAQVLPAPPAETIAFDYQQKRSYSKYQPLVTVIVPNYNHVAYLTQRLESIYAQTYDNFEVLLLDDCSSDDSREVLNDFATRYPDRTRVIFNNVNSGGVFHQWKKGLAEACGDLIWIAESDDWASPNFLETLVPFFQNEVVQLAYARTIFMDEAGEKQIWSMEEYLNQYGPERWSRTWVETAPNIVEEVFSIVNIIPNVSSALFRNFERMDVLEIDDWLGMRTCGDWMFYLNVIRGGMMAYSPHTQNFYRNHDRNTSVTSHKADQFYCEHEAVAKCVRRHYYVAPKNLKRMEANLRLHWKNNRNDYDDKAFTACFDLVRINAAPMRKPTLLMVGYAFCAGGGETFPIQLANEMKAVGYEVTFLDCGQEERVAGVRSKLANDIPVISDFSDLCRIIQNFDIDLIHSHHGWVDNTVLDLMPEDADCRTIITLHGFYETVESEHLKRILPRLLRRTATMVYIADKNLEAMRIEDVPVNTAFRRIDNAIRKAHINPIDRSMLNIPEDAFVLVLVSRALHAKGWAEAIAATLRAREISEKDIHLVLVGDGEARDTAAAAGLPPHIHLEGFRPNTQDYFAAADLGFLPSRFAGESFPLVVIESLIAGTPVLATDIGEIRYMLTTNEGMAGTLFSLKDDWQIDIEALAQVIAALALDPDRMAQLRACVPQAAKRFDPRHMAEQYDEVYRMAITRDKND